MGMSILPDISKRQKTYAEEATSTILNLDDVLKKLQNVPIEKCIAGRL